EFTYALGEQRFVPLERGTNGDWPAELFRTCDEIERMQLLPENPFAVFGFAGAGESVKCFARQIDHRCGGDTNVRLNERAKNVAIGNGGDIFLRVDKTYLPKRLGGSRIGVEGVDAVFFGGDEDDVVRALAGDFELADIQG